MKYIEWKKFDNIRAFTTTREIGNIGYQVGNNYLGVRKARETIAEDLKIPEECIVFVHQTHSDLIKEVTFKDKGKGMLDFVSGVESDALYTKKTNLALGIFHADCVPLFFYIPKKKIVGIIHAGFSGSLKRITEKSIAYLKNEEKVNPKDIFVHIGPSRKFFSYKINKYDASLISALGYEKSLKFSGQHIFVDVPFMNYLQLLKEGVLPENITVTEEDTYDNPRLFSAYEKTPVGRMASIIMRIE